MLIQTEDKLTSCKSKQHRPEENPLAESDLWGLFDYTCPDCQEVTTISITYPASNYIGWDEVEM
jgi:hypothetical protein